MSKYVFILGAGASAHTGAPMMAGFLDRARIVPSGPFEEDFKRVFTAISHLQIVHSKSELDLVNLESVFGAFEMATLLGRFPALGSDEIGKLRLSMRRVIARTLEMSVEVERGGIPFPGGYSNFAEVLKMSLGNMSVITFNYDTALDYALAHIGVGIDYGVDSPQRWQGLPLLKLHGSLNWSLCQSCKKLSSSTIDVYQEGYGNSIPMRLQANLNGIICCDEKDCSEPFIVPPTWDKSQYRATLGRVWSRAATELSNATNIFIVGYSLPESDSFFRYLFALGTFGPELLERIWFINPDEEAFVRVEKMIGPGAKARFQSFHGKFGAEMIGRLGDYLAGRRGNFWVDKG